MRLRAYAEREAGWGIKKDKGLIRDWVSLTSVQEETMLWVAENPKGPKLAVHVISGLSIDAVAFDEDD
jgi:hypothetical protein